MSVAALLFFTYKLEPVRITSSSGVEAGFMGFMLLFLQMYLMLFKIGRNV